MFLKTILPCVKKRQGMHLFIIYVFTEEDIDLVEELNNLNPLLAKREPYEYGEFSVCLDRLLLPDRAFALLSKKKTKKEIENGCNNV